LEDEDVRFFLLLWTRSCDEIYFFLFLCSVNDVMIFCFLVADDTNKLQSSGEVDLLLMDDAKPSPPPLAVMLSSSLAAASL